MQNNVNPLDAPPRRSVRGNGNSGKHILIVGSREKANAFAAELLAQPQWGVGFTGILDLYPGQIGNNGDGEKVLGHLDDLSEVIDSHSIDEVLFLVPISIFPRIERSIAYCGEIGIKTRIAIDPPPNRITRVGVEEIAGQPFIAFSPPPHTKNLLAFKHWMDILLSILILIFASPLFAIIALAIKLTSPGPVLFRQERWTTNGRRFTMLKFRTMVENAEALRFQLQGLNEMSGPVFKISKDPRVTSLGLFLRRYSLDELPQFLNVLMGDMSLVGPRPLPIPEIEKADLRQRRRLSVKPGITCLWQVNGRNNIDFEEWMRLDLEYIDHWSPTLDLKILLKTIPAMLRGTGV